MSWSTSMRGEVLSGKGNWKARRRLVHTGFACLITGPQLIVWVVFRECREGHRLRRFIVVCDGWGCRISIFISLSKRRIFVEDNFILLQTFASRSKMRQKGQGVCFVEIYFCFSVLKPNLAVVNNAKKLEELSA